MPDLSRAVRSLAARLALVALAFAAVPAILYGQFSEAEAVKRELLLSRLQVEGRLIARGLALGLARLGSPSVVETARVLEQLQPTGVTVRLLFRPGRPNDARQPVFLVGALPALAAEAVDAERHRLIDAGVTRAVPESCADGQALDRHYRSASGEEEVLTAIVPFTTEAGCWAVVTSQAAGGPAGALLDRPYWSSPEVQFAAAAYALLMGLVLTVFGALWLNLRRFGREARAVAEGAARPAPFVQINRVPELEGVAREFDRMVGNLRATADAFRYAAEENAHAFKTPIATIAQAVEPLRRAVGDPADRSLQVIEAAVERLDSLVAASRRLDQVNADLVTPPRQTVDVSKLVGTLLDSYAPAAEERAVTLERRITPGCAVQAGIELLETVIENILDNALSFSPEGGRIIVTVARGDGTVALMFDDEGPGAPGDLVERMFDRYVSHRTEADPSGAPHFGIGLWIVRRNVAAIGGTVEARNRDGGGLRVILALPTG